jgi:hypothetical protein
MNNFEFLSKLKQFSPRILSGAAIVGVAATAIQSAKDTPKALKRLEKAKAEGRELKFVDKAIIMAPAYIPTICVGLGTIGCIAGGIILSEKYKGALAAVAATSIAAAEKLKADFKEELPEETYQKVVNKGPGENDIIRGGGDTLFYEETLGYFTCDAKVFLSALLSINKRLQENSGVMLEDFIKELGFSKDFDPEIYAAASRLGWDQQQVYDGAGIAYIEDCNPEKLSEEYDPEDAEPQLKCHAIEWNVRPIVDPWNYDDLGIESV